MSLREIDESESRAALARLLAKGIPLPNNDGCRAVQNRQPSKLVARFLSCGGRHNSSYGSALKAKQHVHHD